jgi:high-affinity nickel-transport protein
MAPLSMVWLPLCLSVFALGLRHGLDADHLAMIDGLTRFNGGARPELARWCGVLFSAGHGCVVILVAITIGSAAVRSAIPGWARDLGARVSIGFLVALGLLNLAVVLRTPADEIVPPTGVRSRLWLRLTQTTRPFAVAAIGALFAVSFDTLSQAVLFSATAAQFGGRGSAAFLGCLFTLGMLLVDGLNGAWVASLLKRADRRARMGISGDRTLRRRAQLRGRGGGVARYFNPRLDGILESRGWLIGVFLVLAAALSSVVLALGCPRRPLRVT